MEPQYFAQRKFNHGMKRLLREIQADMEESTWMLLSLDTSENRDIIYKISKPMGGWNEVANMAYVHKHCQTIFLERRAKA